ncbi:MAG: branched-chain alpha-keto acid dehydrogenase subunit E2 [Candidatus Eremiobacter antarcticus]|nr:2-oxo acid dehydrogenase subunit E2 [Candidatus Eremiobacteraeota bacterium]MBC5807875.1 2-oxo acid dehydrogenase subunit E2 [Candidatus Eremiobacteraeota bacterium]PZR62754.1 MAG: branched-chain alpha-keto acid dehydrogenase subunit E2 [Candidatus Eremiobacter sp. RRmetagenome_bin22]
MPQLGETVTEGTVGRWLKKEGEAVAKYEPLLEVETDKVASEIPSPFAGMLSKVFAEEGATIPVGAPICEIGEATGAQAQASKPVAEAPAQSAGTAVASPVSEPVAASAPASVSAARSAPSQSTDGVRYSPAVRKLVRQHRIDVKQLPGTGRGGRVTAVDVLKLIESGGARPAAPAASAQPLQMPAAHPQPLPIAPPGEGDTVVRVTQMRKTIAERMVLSKTTIPHAWSMVEADVTAVAKWRETEKEAFKAREGANLTFLPIMVLAVCGALREFPAVNSTWAGDKIILRKGINIGIAVEIEDGLVVPVIRDADDLSLAGVARAVHSLAGKARSRKLTMEEMTDGSITVDNTGALGSIASVPIINPPQAAIITMEAVVKRPWVINDAIAIRSIMNVCLCLDHRVLDGAIASRFLQSVKRRLETFSV